LNYADVGALYALTGLALAVIVSASIAGRADGNITRTAWKIAAVHIAVARKMKRKKSDRRPTI
jgi:hypothetical protein